jgi:hypothetical protein
LVCAEHTPRQRAYGPPLKAVTALMTNIPTWLDDGASTATCQLLGAGTAVAAAFAANSARTLLFWPTIAGATASLAFAAAGHAIGCAANDGNPPDTGQHGGSGSWCQDGTGQTRACRIAANGTPTCSAPWIIHGPVTVQTRDPGQEIWEFWALAVPASNPTATPTEQSLVNWNITTGQRGTLEVITACTDERTIDTPLDTYTFQYTDATTSCVYNYVLTDTWIDSDGFPRLAWAVDGDTGGVLRNNCQGGRIAGYVWAPQTINRYIYNVDFDGPGSGPPDGPDWIFNPDWGAIGGLLMRLMEYNDPGDFYRLTSVCETNNLGEPVDRAVEVTIPAGFRNPGASSRVRFEAMVELMQGLKDFRQPTCLGSSATGQLVSVDFTSDQPSPGGTRPLRKLMRYRDQTNTPLPDHVAHWDTFTWEAGPVIVKHINGPWGQVQVWAQDADEGRRVIRHAGQIAGVDPDVVGEWRITSSRDPRYGQTGTMRLARRSTWGGQILQISKRDGPNGLPTVPCDCG